MNRRVTNFNNPIYYNHVSADFGFSCHEVPSNAIYASKEGEEIVADTNPWNAYPADQLVTRMDEIDLAIVEEIGRSKYLSSLQIYQFLILRGMRVKRDGVRNRLNKLKKWWVIREYGLKRSDTNGRLPFYGLSDKGAWLAIKRGVVFHKGNRYLNEKAKMALNITETAEDVKRILAGNMIILGLLMNQARIRRFGVMETMRPVQRMPLSDGSILRTAANVQIDDDSLLLYEVVRSAPHALERLADKVRRYYILVNNENYQAENYYGYRALPQLVICGESYEHNCRIDSWLRSQGLWSAQDSLLYTEDLFYVQATLRNLYELDEHGNRSWYSLPSRITETEEKRRDGFRDDCSDKREENSPETPDHQEQDPLSASRILDIEKMLKELFENDGNG